MLTIDRTALRLPPDQYVPQTTDKRGIVLHFTAGTTASGAFASWAASPERVATAYILDRDGQIYETFPPEQWAWHLGCALHEPSTIGIEIVNVGPLKRRGDDLYWWPENYTRYVYCTMADTTRYVRADYRGFSYYAAFLPKQMDALPALLYELEGRFLIPHTLVGHDRFDLPAMKDFRGIAAHQNYRADKMDVGPAFQWDLIR